MGELFVYFRGRFWLVWMILVVGMLIPTSVQAAEYDPFGTDTHVLTKDKHYTERGVPNVVLETHCPENGDCRSRVVNNQGTVLKTFSTESTVQSIARTRYWGKAYLLVKESYECDDSTCQRTIFFNNNGTAKQVRPGWDQIKSLDVFITFKGNLGVLLPDGFHVWTQNGDHILETGAPESLTRGRIQADLNGSIAVIGVSSSNKVWLGDGESWKSTDLTLTKRGDRRGILTAYPISDDGTAGVVYDYENVFRKGLYLVRTKGDSGPIFLSSERNVGWDPELFITEDQYYISATDSTHDRRTQVRVPRSRLQGEELPEPEVDQFPEGGNTLSMFVGGGVMSRYWRAGSEVEKNGTTFTDVDYNFDRSLLRSLRFQGRVGSTRYVLSYLKQIARNEVENEAGEASSEGVEYLMGTVEFEDFFSPASGLRLEYRRSETNGLATVKHRSKPDTSQSFDVEFQELGLYQIRERGMYYGLEYTDYQLPSAVGFSNEFDRIAYSDFDSEFGFQTLSIMGGYDPQSYAKRYETNYSDWFVSGEGGAGLGWADISGSTEKRAKSSTGKEDISIPTFFALEASMESGYLWQRRARLLGGLGVQTMIGYRADGTYMFSGRGEDNDDDELVLEFERTDLWHGPFVEVNVIF